MEYTFDAYQALEAKPEMLAIHICPSILTKADSGIEGVSGCDFYLPFADEWVYKQFCSQDILFNSLPEVTSGTSGDSNDVHFCYKGLSNTQQILAEAPDKGVTTAACSYCASQTLTIKKKGMSGEVATKTLQGFLGEYGQLFAIKTVQSAINAIRALKGLSAMDITLYNWWSCTQYSSRKMWRMFNGSPNDYFKTYQFIALPLYA